MAHRQESKCAAYCVHPTIGFFVDVLLPVVNMGINVGMLIWATYVMVLNYKSDELTVAQSYDVNQQSIFTLAHGGAAIAALIDYARGTEAPALTFTLSTVYSAVTEFLYGCRAPKKRAKFILAKTNLKQFNELV